MRKHKSMALALFTSLLIIGACAVSPYQNSGSHVEVNQNSNTSDSVTMVTSEFAPTKEEIELYQLIIAYRKEKGLASIPLSISLTSVAKQHCQDLYSNAPDQSPCNAHSWSDKGVWTPCCYTPDHKNASCIWTKPAEMTEYKGYGYEIACGSSNPAYSSFVMTAEYALKSWKGSSGHNAVILNLSPWEDRTWNAIGIGIYKGFACVWFGEEVDPAGNINIE